MSGALAMLHTRAVQGMARGEVVGAVEHHIRRSDQPVDVAPRHALRERHDLDFGIHCGERLARFLQRIGNSFASIPRNGRGYGVFRVGERCFSL